MPPKGSKRGAQAAATTPTPQQQKKQKTGTGKKLTGLMSGVVDALEKAEDLPADCRAMLEACIPASLSTPASERHEAQASVISWIGEVVESVQAKLQEALDSAATNLAEAEGLKKELDDKLAEVQAALAKEGERVAALKAFCADKDSAMKTAKRGLLEAQEKQKMGTAFLAHALTSKQEIEAVLETQVKYLQSDEGFDSGKAREYVAEVLPMAVKLGLDDSLKNALPLACTTEPGKRRTFDQMVLCELKTTFTARVADLANKLASGAEAEAFLAAAVELAQQEINAAEEALAVADNELKSAEAKEAEAATAVSAAEAAARVAAKEVDIASAATKERQAELGNFKDYNLLCFTMLRDKAANEVAAAPVAEG